jgi:hypothetical protein
MDRPLVKTHLPELMHFTQQLAHEHLTGSLTNWRGFIERVRNFYTPAMMDKIELVVPGWAQMATYADQQTLIHVTSVLTALFLLPEYQEATLEQQALMEWMVVFHDVAKEAQSGQHDYIHAFRSAAITGRALGWVGFPTTMNYPAQIDAWCTLTHTAILYHETHQENIQDNRKLPEILGGIESLFGPNAAAGLVIKGVLLHLSIATDPEYPTVAPLTDDEIGRYIDTALYPLLKMMLLVDTDAWNLFDTATQQHKRQQILAVFDTIGKSIGVL